MYTYMFFRNKVAQFKEKYKTESRRIKLNEEEKQEQNESHIKDFDVC